MKPDGAQVGPADATQPGFYFHPTVGGKRNFRKFSIFGAGAAAPQDSRYVLAESPAE
jgi:hypothetical protein